MEQTTGISISESSESFTVTGTGELDLKIAQQFKDALERGTRSSSQLAVDFRKSYYIDTAILQALVDTQRILSKKNSRLRVVVLAGSHPDYVLKTVGFSEVMDIVVEDGPQKTPGGG